MRAEGLLVLKVLLDREMKIIAMKEEVPDHALKIMATME
jgi:hypothetical protein